MIALIAPEAFGRRLDAALARHKSTAWQAPWTPGGSYRWDPIRAAELRWQAAQRTEGWHVEETTTPPAGFPDAPTVPYYSVDTDTIFLLPRAWCPDAATWYRLAFHEACHATGHGARLGRRMELLRTTATYRPEEELVAEAGAAYLTDYLGFETWPAHVAYLAHWAQAAHPDALRAAVWEGWQAARWVLGIKPAKGVAWA